MGFPLPKDNSKLSKFSVILGDGKWHTISEIAEKINANVDKVEKACDILAEFGLIEREGEKIKQCSFLKD